MPSLSHGRSPARARRGLDIPRDYNAAHDLVERNLRAGRAAKTAYIDDRRAPTRTAISPRA